MLEESGLRGAFELRYQVYCIERSFLSADQFAGRAEYDEYDHTSIHFVADFEGTTVGHVRLVYPVGSQFPFQRHCNLFPQTSIHDGVSAEVSRLAISKSFVSQHGSRKVVRLPTGESVPWRNAIALCLFKGMYQYSVSNGIQYWYAAMERSLERMLRRYGVCFKPIGDEADYYGPVSPYLIAVGQLCLDVCRCNSVLHEWLCDGAQPEIDGVRAFCEPTESASESATSARRFAIGRMNE